MRRGDRTLWVCLLRVLAIHALDDLVSTDTATSPELGGATFGGN